MTSNEVLGLREVPRSLLVIGGGYIAVEFASVLAGLGAKVALEFRNTRPLRCCDHDLRERVAQAPAARSVALASGVGLQALVRSSSDFELLRADGSVLGADAVLNVACCRPNTAGFGLEDPGVRLYTRGALAVDIDSRTTASGV